MNRFAIADCTSVDAALSQLKDGAVVKAGGVDLLDRMKDGIEQPEKLVNVIASGGWVSRRASYRSSDFQCIRKGKDLCFAFEGLNQYHAIMEYATCPSVAPSSAAVALLGLNASVELSAAKRGKRTVGIRELYVVPDANPTKFTVIEPDDLLTAIVIPKPAAGTRSAYQKYGEKESFDWAIADAGVVLEMDGGICRRAVITMGAASPVVRRATQAEAALAGKPITEETARAAGQVAVQGAQPLSMNSYKLDLFPVAVYRTILYAAGQRDRDPGAAG